MGRKKAVFAALLVLLVFAGTACIPGTKKTPQDMACLSFGGGPFEGPHYQGYHEPGKGLFINGLFDKLYCYPTTQRTYIISSRADESDLGTADSIVAPSDDSIDVTFEMTVYFELATDEENLLAFHQEIGIKTKAFTEDGWEKMLNDYFRQQIESAVQKQARSFDAVEMYADQSVFLSIQNGLATTLPSNINEALGDDYMTNFRVVLRKIDLPQATKEELVRNKNSEIAIETKKNEVAQAELEAEAIEKRQKAFENCDVCILYEAIKSGTIDFWVIPNGQDLTLQTPNRRQ